MLAGQITTHVQDALNRLLEQYKNRPRMIGLITAFAQQIQDLENAIFSIDAGRQLTDGFNYKSVGAQLDGIGQIVGIQRNGLDDSTYLVLILGTIAENYSNTTADEILHIISTVFETNSVFKKDPNSTLPDGVQPYISFSVGGPGLPESLYNLVEFIIKNAIAAGVPIGYIGIYDSENPFAFDSGGGFGDETDPSVGGEFGDLIFSNPSA